MGKPRGKKNKKDKKSTEPQPESAPLAVGDDNPVEETQRDEEVAEPPIAETTPTDVADASSCEAPTTTEAEQTKVECIAAQDVDAKRGDNTPCHVTISETREEPAVSADGEMHKDMVTRSQHQSVDEELPPRSLSSSFLEEPEPCTAPGTVVPFGATVVPVVGADEPESLKGSIAHPPPHSANPNLTTMQMLWELLLVAAPSVVSLVFMFATQTITMSFVGHRLGFLVLAQFSVGLSVYNVLGASIGIGFCGAIDTLAPQAFGRDPHTPELGNMLQRATLLNLAFAIPLGIGFQYLEPALALIYGESLAVGAAAMLRALPVYMILAWTGSVLNRLFPAQHLASVPLYANIIGTVSAYVICKQFMTAQSTITDAVVMLTVVQAIITVVLIAALIFHPKSILKNAKYPCKELFDWEPLRAYVKLGLASMFGTCSEWWAFELLQMLCAQLGETEVAAYTIMLNTLLVLFSVACGISIGAGTMIGNALGANQPGLARKYLHLSYKVSGAATTVTVGSLWFYGVEIMKFYTVDEEVLGLIRPIVHLVAVWHMMDACQSTVQGIFRGAGKQKIAAMRVLITLWAIGLPLAAIFGIWLKFGLVAVIGGQFCGVLLLGPSLLWDAQKWDWEELARVASHDGTRDLPEGVSFASASSSHHHHRHSDDADDMVAKKAHSALPPEEVKAEHSIVNISQQEDDRTHDSEISADLTGE